MPITNEVLCGVPAATPTPVVDTTCFEEECAFLQDAMVSADGSPPVQWIKSVGCMLDLLDVRSLARSLARSLEHKPRHTAPCRVARAAPRRTTARHIHMVGSRVASRSRRRLSSVHHVMRHSAPTSSSPSPHTHRLSPLCVHRHRPVAGEIRHRIAVCCQRCLSSPTGSYLGHRRPTPTGSYCIGFDSRFGLTRISQAPHPCAQSEHPQNDMPK